MLIRSSHYQFLSHLNRPLYWGIACLLLFLLACSNLPIGLGSESPTATPVVIRFEVSAESLPAPTETLQVESQAEAPAQPVSPPAAVTPTPFPPLINTLEPAPAGLQPIPTQTPLSQPAALLGQATATPIAAEAAGVGIYTGEITDQISLIDPGSAFSLPLEMDQLEFKWQWTGEELRPCQLPEGFGFDLRIWPDPNHPNVSAAQRQLITPQGVFDAVQDQEMITASCDPRTGTRRFIVTGLKSAPGIKQIRGVDHFLWDVAYVQLDPYIVSRVSFPSDFFIPALAATPAAGPTPAPTPVFQLTPGPKPEGVVILEAPTGKPTFAANVGQVEFRWRWEGQTEGPCLPADGYGFELRIWSQQPGFTPLGVIDAATDQDLIACNPETGIYSYIVSGLTLVPGVKDTYVGEVLHWDGQFLWDVALVSIRPYLPPDSASQPGAFEITLNDYPGPLDPFGEPLKCSDFGAWPEAQAVFLKAGGPNRDPHNIDPDGNGIACDELRQ